MLDHCGGVLKVHSVLKEALNEELNRQSVAARRLISHRTIFIVTATLHVA